VPDFYLCYTVNGRKRHLTPAQGTKTLCGFKVDHLETNWRTGSPILYGSHWSNAAGTGGNPVCENCDVHAGRGTLAPSSEELRQAEIKRRKRILDP